jgi:hypothetical protein
MPYLTVENFKFGLDTRRSDLTSQAGVLAVCENAHINQGGEVEKRKAFVLFADVSILDGNGDTGTFGIEDSSTNVVVFGSALPHGSGVTLSQPVLASNMPAGVTYQQLKHPFVNGGGTYDRTKHRMTQVRCSCTYKGNTFVVATFVDGNVFEYSNGSLVKQSSYGLFLSGFAIADIQAQLSENFALYGWQFFANSGSANYYNSFVTPTNTTNLLYGGPATATTFTTIISVSSASGGIGDLKENGSGTIATQPSTAAVTISGTTNDNFTIQAPAYPGSNEYVALNISVAWGTDNPTTATAIKNAINSRTAVTGFSATVSTNVVTVIAPLPTSGGSYNQGVAVLVKTNLGGTTLTNFNFGNGNGLFTGNYGQQDLMGIGGTWLAGDTWTITIVPSSGNAFTVGRGNLNGIGFNYALPFGKRVILGGSSQFNLSGIDDPTKWERQDTGASTIPFTSNFGGVDTVQSLAIYQGRLAVFGTYSIQIWTGNADPTQWALNQTLTNIGTDAPQSVQAFGELDVFFRSLSGVRSLRVRDSSLNGYVTDIGSPIDGILTMNTAAQRQASISVIEPTNHRYWLYENGVIYVLTYFPTLKISAWSTYLPQYDATSVITIGNFNGSGLVNIDSLLTPGTTYTWVPDGHETDIVIDGVSHVGPTTFVFTAQAITARGIALATSTAILTGHLQTTFTPEKFLVHASQVYVRATDGKIHYLGGSGGTTYDFCVATVETPWLDVKSRVETRKNSTSVGNVITGTWDMYASMDYRTGNSTLKLKKLGDGIDTPDQGVLPYTAQGTHIKMQMKTSAVKAEAAVLSAMVWHYTDGGEKR